VLLSQRQHLQLQNCTNCTIDELLRCPSFVSVSKINRRGEGGTCCVYSYALPSSILYSNNCNDRYIQRFWTCAYDDYDTSTKPATRRRSTSSVSCELRTLSPPMTILKDKYGNDCNTRAQHTKARESPSISKLSRQRASSQRQESACQTSRDNNTSQCRC
jgi:hypothetical protein